MPLHEGNRSTPGVRKHEVLMEKDGITVTVKDSSVAVYERNGWTRVDDGTSETDPETGADDHQGGGFLSGVLLGKDDE